jgi:uncharacterized protein (TIGR00255 family)
MVFLIEGQVVMAHSMTGFGRGQVFTPERRCGIEIKSVNGKYLDIQIRLPKILNGIENRIRDTVASQMNRGKIEVYVFYEDFREESKEVFVDLSLVKAYRQAFDQISDFLGTTQDLKASLMTDFPDIIRIHPAASEDDELWKFIYPALSDAIQAVVQTRGQEGTGLIRDVSLKCEQLRKILSRICERAPSLSVEFSERLHKRIEELIRDLDHQKIDEQRMAAEVAMFADKCAIDEEIVRLDVHFQQLEVYLEAVGPIGKKIDFLVQEINREINTIGSKANDLSITKSVLEMKSLMENIREQIQNVE